MRLFAERGFAATTGAMIAAEAATTERTYYRHFKDKADVAFGDEERLQLLLSNGVRDAPSQSSGWLSMVHGLNSLATDIGERRAEFERRATVVEANVELRDRERARAAMWTSVAQLALIARGIDAATAYRSAAIGMTCFGVALQEWFGHPGESLPSTLNKVLTEIRMDLQG